VAKFSVCKSGILLGLAQSERKTVGVSLFHFAKILHWNKAKAAWMKIGSLLFQKSAEEKWFRNSDYQRSIISTKTSCPNNNTS
jgi:hypothetical protein